MIKTQRFFIGFVGCIAVILMVVGLVTFYPQLALKLLMVALVLMAATVVGYAVSEGWPIP